MVAFSREFVRGDPEITRYIYGIMIFGDKRCRLNSAHPVGPFIDF